MSDAQQTMYYYAIEIACLTSFDDLSEQELDEQGYSIYDGQHVLRSPLDKHKPIHQFVRQFFPMEDSSDYTVVVKTISSDEYAEMIADPCVGDMGEMTAESLDQGSEDLDL